MLIWSFLSLCFPRFLVLTPCTKTQKPPVIPPPTQPRPPFPVGPGRPTNPPEPTSTPSAQPTAMCFVGVNQELCPNVTIDQEPIEGCDCYNYCNGEFNGCCGFFEATECEQDCDGVVVSGCELDFDFNMTEIPNATLAPNSTDPPEPPQPPGGGTPQPPGGGGPEPPQPPGGNPEPPGGGGPEPPGGTPAPSSSPPPQPPGGNPEPPGGSGPEPPGETPAPSSNAQPPGPPGGGETPEPPGSPGGSPGSPGGETPGSPGSPGTGTAPGGRQFENEDGSIVTTLPPYALRFFLPKQENQNSLQEIESELFVQNAHPTHADYIALESITDEFLRDHVMKHIGNGLNVVMDDLQTIVLTKPGNVEVARAGRQNDESTATMPYDSLFIVFVSTATFDSTSATIPHAASMLKHIQDAFTGNSLTSYLGMLQALQLDENYETGGDFFASTTDILWVAANPSTDANQDSSSATNQSATTSDPIGPIFIAIFSIAIIVLFMMILRLNGGLRFLDKTEKKSKRETEFDNIFQSSSSLEVYEIENKHSQDSLDDDTDDAVDNSFKNEAAEGEENARPRDPPGIVLDPLANNINNQQTHGKPWSRRGLGIFGK